MTDDEAFRPQGDEAGSDGELVAHELAHVTQAGGGAPEAPSATPSETEAETIGEEVAHVVESAAELGLGAVIGPFTGGETVNIVGSVASMFEAGVDRLTHLGEHESPPDPDDDAPPSRPVPDVSIPDSEPGYSPDDGRE